MIENIYAHLDNPFFKDKKRLGIYYQRMLGSRIDFNDIKKIGVIGIDYYSILKNKLRDGAVEYFTKPDLEFPQNYDDNCDYVYFEKIETNDMRQYLLIIVRFEDYDKDDELRIFKELTQEEISSLPDYKIIKYENIEKK